MESSGVAEHRAYKGNNSEQARIPVHDCPLSESTGKLLNRVVLNGTLRGVEGEGRISPIRFCGICTGIGQVKNRLNGKEKYKKLEVVKWSNLLKFEVKKKKSMSNKKAVIN